MSRPDHDFDYLPELPPVWSESDHTQLDVVVAASCAVSPQALSLAVHAQTPNPNIEPLIESAPLFWYRVRSGEPCPAAHIKEGLARAGMPLRYVTPSRVGSMRVAPPFDAAPTAGRPSKSWTTRTRATTTAVAGRVGERWFAGPLGVDSDSGVGDAGFGTRLAVIDNDGGALDTADLDAMILVGVDSPPLGSHHALSMVAWATGARSASSGRFFEGIAPGASSRLYVVPKPGQDVFSVPLAIARAALDGADVIVCSTNLDGLTGPLLDDALAVASTLGRDGRGTAVVFAVGRDFSSPPGRTHASLSVGLSDPAGDPRVFCVGPSSATGGWFLWPDKRGQLRPFANRGPSLRWLAPGDDVIDPARMAGPLGHTESSGASAFAAGALLLLVAANPELTTSEIDEIVTRTAITLRGDGPVATQLADPCDALPTGVDADGHNAKHGYGRISATLACLVACDPVTSALVLIGDPEAALLVWKEFCSRPRYSREFGRWAARAMLRDRGLMHGVCALVRHSRLVACRQERAARHPPGTIARALYQLLQQLLNGGVVREPSAAIRSEAEAIAAWAFGVLESPHPEVADRGLFEIASLVFWEQGAGARCANH